jgi:hypothetical protein
VIAQPTETKVKPTELNSVLMNIPAAPEAFFKVVALPMTYFSTRESDLKLGDIVAYVPRTGFFRKVEANFHNGRTYALGADHLEFIGYR